MSNGNYFSNQAIKILFADDDPDVQDLVRLICAQAEMNVSCVNDGKQALDLLRKVDFDLVILDIMMPGIDGLETLRRIRLYSDIPVVMLTARGMESEIVSGFEAGADDYIVKPFRKNEFISRLRAVHSRSKRPYYSITGQISIGNVILDTGARQVRHQGRTINVTPQEFQLLKYLMQNPGIVLSREDLLRNVWGYGQNQMNHQENLNFIEAAIRRLRKKLEVDPSEPRMIRTVWGAGYRFGN